MIKILFFTVWITTVGLMFSATPEVLSQEVSESSPFGSNPTAGSYFAVNGVQLYYEVYGAGEPLLLVHGNGGSIAGWRMQIPYFRNLFTVIAVDSRAQGKSGSNNEDLTYEMMTDDLAALIEHLDLGPVNVLGWSDGGIQALMLAMRHPDKVRKIIAMAANLNPSSAALADGVEEALKGYLDMLASDNNPTNLQKLKVAGITLSQPDIKPEELEAIAAPTLILVGDHDFIRDEHTLEIFHHVPNSQLGIFPNATHTVPFDEPELFNAAVDRFLRTPFVNKDRIADAFSSIEKIEAPQ